MPTRIRIVLVLAAIWVVHVGLANGQETSPANLKGLTGIAVHVGTPGDPTVSMTQLEATITQRLRQAGITIVQRQAPRPYGTQGHLFANVMILRRPGNDQCFLNVQLKLYGSVVLAGSNERGETITWETERLAMSVPTTDVDARVRNDLDFLVDGFAKAYVAANPK